MGNFPPDYATARDRFREAAARLGWRRQAYPVPARGPAGEDLTVDVAVSRSEPADRVLVLSSGLHGVEGHFGSAVQVAALERWAREGGPPPDVRCVLVHALNPYGFAWSRRCDAENVDVNRNFALDDHGGADADTRYAAFDRLLNPRRPPSRRDLFPLRALWAVAVHGKGPLERALVAGQSRFPKGLFFGGVHPSATRTILEQHLASWIGPTKRVLHLDFHTGLGSWGAHRLLVDYPLTPGGRGVLTRWFGAHRIAENQPHPGGIAYRARGSLGPWCVARQKDSEYLFAFAEFGTYGNIAVIAGLRAENQAHHWAGPGDRRTARARARLRELFCPASPRWRSAVLADGLHLVRRGVAGLTGERPGAGPAEAAGGAR